MPGRTEKVSEEKEPARETFAPIKDALSEIFSNFLEGSDKVADIVLDKSHDSRSSRAGKITDGTVCVAKDILLAIKANLGLLTLKGVLCDTSYELGRFSRITENACGDVLDDLME